jgi:hypothetical protein
MKTLLAVMASLLVSCHCLYAQVVPDATGGATNFTYFLRYSQTAHFGGGLGDWQTANPSGEVEFYNGRRTTPFNLSYLGGYAFTLAGPSHYSTGFFQYLSLHQGLPVHKWQLTVGDNVSYRPQAPVTGLSGVPGTGEPIVVVPPPDQSILTVGTHALNNLVTGEVSRPLSTAFSVSLGAEYDLLLYPDGNGLDTHSLSANGALTRQLDGRSSVFGEYVYSTFRYPNLSLTINAHLVTAGYERALTRRLHTDLGIGPEWINSSDSTSVPSSMVLTGYGDLSYRMRTGSVFGSYNRGTGGGSGFLVGQLTDSVAGGYSCLVGRMFSAELIGGFRRVSPLDSSGAVLSGFGAAQASWLFGRHLSVFINYTIVSQTSDIALPNNVVNGALQTISFGTTLSPRSKHRF